ncbi:uncharacterized protein DC041_0010142 [Schistosoma bovis]|uniref:Reverse transcriptase domain-containing protein n=1 Tax=Schistosoma bovis TaxID=6184 RepID=A0A430Q3G1_SCHBO|nr:uncharacterized protein DC041_0010142 [Schistosoma bovis]
MAETHWTQAGQKRLATGEMLLYSGHEEDNAPHTQGVALMLSKVARNALVGWESHGSRIIEVSFKTKKEGRLQSTIEKCPRNDLTILMGDLNAKRNENGEKFANLCAFYKLNQIDHICINKKFRRTMEDVRTRRGADIASDHHLVLKKNWTNGQTALQRFNTAFLRDTIALNNRFQALRDLLKEEETTMEDNWKGIKEALTSTCQEVLGLKKYHHKEWTSTETNKKKTINNSRIRAQKVQAQAEYIEANKQVKRIIRDDKQKYVKELATMAEKAAREGNMKQLYDTTRKLAGKYSVPERPIKDKEGKPITEIQQQRNRWVEYFEELNRPATMNPTDIEAAHTDLPIDINPLTTEEIRMAIRQIKPLRSNIKVTTNMLRLLFKKIWEEEQVSMDWKEGHLVKIPKKGDLSKCENYRGITLLSIPGKVFNRVLLNRMKDAVDAQLRDQQAGFRKDRSCTDQIATLRIIVEQSVEWNSSLYINFIDYETAFDSVDRRTLLKLLRHYRVPEKIVNVMQNSYDGLHCKVVHRGLLTDALQVRTGVRQGILLIVPVYKKGKKSSCDNHRRISLTKIVSKILASTRENQAGFRPGRGCIDQIFTLRQVLEHRHTFRRPTIVVFFDLKVTFDSVDSEVLWQCLPLKRVPKKYIDLIQALYFNTSGRVRAYGELSSELTTSSGVRQGCPLSPFLFNFVIDVLLEITLSSSKFTGVELLPGGSLVDLEYADDIVLFGEDADKMQSLLTTLSNNASMFGMRFSPSKCKMLLQDWVTSTPELVIGSEVVECVDRFTYLGSFISPCGLVCDEISARIQKAHIRLTTKGHVYCTGVRSVLLYGCETWPERVEDIRTNAVVRKRILGRDGKSTDEVVKLHQLRWLEHVLRMPNHRLPRRAMFHGVGVGWKKARGGQTKSWHKSTKSLTSGLSHVDRCRLPGRGPRDDSNRWLETLNDMAQNRLQCSVNN